MPPVAYPQKVRAHIGMQLNASEHDCLEVIWEDFAWTKALKEVKSFQTRRINPQN
jgi:hypothetical protein